MNSLMSASLVLIIALPALALATVPLVGGSSRGAARTGSALNGLALLSATFLLLGVTAGGPVSAGLAAGGETLIGLHADRVLVVLLMLVTGVSAVVQAFAGRYLQGDIRAARFFAGANLLTLATAAMVASATLVGMAVAWTVSGVALLLLLGMYPGLVPAEEGFRRTRKAFFAGDLALWAGVVIATLEWGNLNLQSLGEAELGTASGEVTVALVSCLLVVAALSRSAQIPFQSWLPATLAVPTPVSALLHAGVVNAGGILLIKTSPLFGESTVATHLAFAAGAITAVYGTALMLSKPDVKGALAHSTTGQMGFMIMTCGLGAWAAAVFHLVAHGMYKASLFLGSGSAVSRHVRGLEAPPAKPADAATQPGLNLISIALPGLILLAAALAFYPDLTSPGGALLLFAWATATWLSRGWLRRDAGARGLLVATLVLCAGGALYVFALGTATVYFEPALVAAGESTVSPWWLAALLPAVLLSRPLAGTAAGRIAEFRKTAYVLALGASEVRSVRPASLGSGRIPSTAPPGMLTSPPGARP